MILLLLIGLAFPPGLLAYACYLLFRNAHDGSLNAERLVVGVFLIAVALFGVVAWAGALTAAFGR